MLLKNDLQLKYGRCIINARSHSGAIFFSLVQSEGSTRKREREKDGGKGTKKKESERERPAERESGKEREACFFFVFNVCLPSRL